MPAEIRKTPWLATQTFLDDVLNDSFGVASVLRNAGGIAPYRVVTLNAETRETGELRTDNVTVGYFGTAGNTGQIVGVVQDGHTETEFNAQLMPGTNRDYNVTVTLLGVQLVEVVPGQAVALGASFTADATGRASGAGTLVPYTVIEGATGVGTATNPEYIRVIVR